MRAIDDLDEIVEDDDLDDDLDEDIRLHDAIRHETRDLRIAVLVLMAGFLYLLFLVH